ncbi:MAG: hypothetical protein QM743_04740 [Chitinophagaceae bacterium]
MEDRTIGEEQKQSAAGQKFGFILSLICIGVSVLLAWMGHDAVAGILGGSTIVGLVTIFVIGKKQTTSS